MTVTTTVMAVSYIVTTTNDSGPGSLREAIKVANTNKRMDVIAVAIPGAGVPVIRPASALPAITESSNTLDGFSQAAGRVELDGSLVPGADGRHRRPNRSAPVDKGPTGPGGNGEPFLR